MQRIKIAILDEEKEYVLKLTAYLQRYGKGKWDITAFTSEQLLSSYMEKQTIDILVGTNRRSVMQLGGEKPFIRLWLTDKKLDSYEKIANIYCVYRFRSAEEIGKHIEGIVRQEYMKNESEKPMVAVYSPVGRCGKTTLALEVVRNRKYGKWLYIGMEDYSSFHKEKECVADEILYYWKEHNGEKMLSLLEEAGNVIATGSSLFDARQMNIEDTKWFKDILQKSDYRGVVFDIGTGVIQNFRIFEQFDYLLVPYIDAEQAFIKKSNFESLFGVYGMEEYKEKIHFINMDNKLEITSVIQKIFGGYMG